MTIKLHTKLAVFICSLLAIVIVVLALLFQSLWSSSVKEQIGIRALHLAKTVAAMPEIRQAFAESDPTQSIQPLAETIRKQTGALFVVVGNREGIRYSHPIPERIGMPMMGGDNGPVLEGHAIISEAKGSMGVSLRGKAPIVDDQDQVIGVVSVGFLLEHIQETQGKQTKYTVLIAAACLLLGMIGAWMIAGKIKQATHGLEPEEIGRLYTEKQAILQSLREGILAVNAKGQITAANLAAKRMLDVPPDMDVTGVPVTEILPKTRLLNVMRSGKAEFDAETVLGEHIVVANRIPIIDGQDRIIGAVSSFRSVTELNELKSQLSLMKKYADGLRAQTHEFANKLHLISGLIQLDLYDEALEVIVQETDSQEDMIEFVTEQIPDPIIGGLLIGKFNRAKELKVELALDRESSFCDVPKHISRSDIVTILGNVIDNAMEAVLLPGARGKRVTIFMTDLGRDLLIEVSDEGPGIADADRERIFEAGFSTKASSGRGVGLSLVRQAIRDLGGSISISSSPLEGTTLLAVIPKGEQQ
ncbi:ATP-binding protein [Paenibacillus turpanensis]|uniref:ATP-binding protein n=1 Tax=Paenibacillus turpanensis TaxID=2689078 RepID=UPI00140BE6B1|nr:sensor histidine kinase [Paenibacillus turpanensis]